MQFVLTKYQQSTAIISDFMAFKMRGPTLIHQLTAPQFFQCGLAEGARSCHRSFQDLHTVRKLGVPSGQVKNAIHFNINTYLLVNSCCKEHFFARTQELSIPAHVPGWHGFDWSVSLTEDPVQQIRPEALIYESVILKSQVILVVRKNCQCIYATLRTWASEPFTSLLID